MTCEYFQPTEQQRCRTIAAFAALNSVREPKCLEPAMVDKVCVKNICRHGSIEEKFEKALSTRFFAASFVRFTSLIVPI